LKAISSKIRIVGSITSNQYTEETDIDVHIVPKSVKDWNDKSSKKLKKWFDENRDKIHGYIGSHPIEVYIQVHENQDLLSIGLYEVLTRQWIKGPKLVPLDYNPYEDFSHIADDIRDTVEDADLLLGELKRDVIDFETLHSAMKRMSATQKKQFLNFLEKKLDEIEEGINELYRLRKDLVKTRQVQIPKTPEDALQDVQRAKSWEDANALFKFVARYNYLRVIQDLKDLLEDDGLSVRDINTIKQIVGGNDVS
jgi:hypothetical protein